MMGKEEREMPLTGWKLLPHYHAWWRHNGHGIASAATVLPPILVLSIRPPSDVPMSGSGVFICSARDHLWSYSCPICCKFKGINSEVILLCHDAVVTPYYMSFFYSNQANAQNLRESIFQPVTICIASMRPFNSV